MMGYFYVVLLYDDFFELNFFSKNYFRKTIRVSTVKQFGPPTPQMRCDILSGLVWVITVCKVSQQTTLVGRVKEAKQFENLVS